MGVFRPGQFIFVCLPPDSAPGSKRLWLLNISAPNSWPSYTRGLCLASGFWQVVTKVVVCFLPGACGVRCLMCMGDSLETTCGCSGGLPLLPLRGRCCLCGGARPSHPPFLSSPINVDTLPHCLRFQLRDNCLAIRTKSGGRAMETNYQPLA